jgi:threonyl-tRNA synthetase
LIEQHAGTFPAWLAPIQVEVLTIAERHNDYAQQVFKILESKGIRVKIDLRNEKIGFKIREHSMQRVPYLVIIGDKELEEQNMTVRTQKGDDLGSLSIENFSAQLAQVIANKE